MGVDKLIYSLQRPMASPTLILSPVLMQKLKSEELACFDTGASNTTTTVDPILNPAICTKAIHVALLQEPKYP
jgi:hypothetical protein